MDFGSSNYDFKYNPLSVNLDLERQYEEACKISSSKKVSNVNVGLDLEYYSVFGLVMPSEYCLQLEPYLEQYSLYMKESTDRNECVSSEWSHLRRSPLSEIPPVIFLVTGLFRLTLEQTIALLTHLSIVKVLFNRIRASTPRQYSREEAQKKSQFLRQCTPNSRLSNSETLSRLYDFVEGDEGLFLLGAFFILDYTINTSLHNFIDGTFLPEKNASESNIDGGENTTRISKSNNQKRPVQSKFVSEPVATTPPVKSSIDFGDGFIRARPTLPEPSNFSELMKELDSDIDRVKRNQELMISFRELEESVFGNGTDHVKSKTKSKKKNGKNAKKAPKQKSKPKNTIISEDETTKTEYTDINPENIWGFHEPGITYLDSSDPDQDSDDRSEYDYADELDNDPEFLSLLEYFSDVFPKVARSELKLRLISANNVEELMEDLMLEEETYDIIERLENDKIAEAEESKPTKKYSADVYRLKDMFPNHDNDVLEKVLESHYGDMQLASVSLLNNDETRFVKKKNDSVWASRLESFQASVKSLKSLVGLSNEEVVRYLHQNRRNFFDALEDIVYNYRKRLEVPPLRNLIPAGGRVQGSKARATPLYANASSKNIKTLDKESPERQELASIYASNPAMQVFKLEFLMKCLEFFGNVYRVVEVGHYLIDNNILPDVKNKLTTKVIKPEITLPKIDVKVAFENYHKNLSNKKATLEVIDMKLIDDFKKTGVVDLHGYKLKHGLEITRQILKIWWDEEINRRVDEGELSKYGSKAQFVDSATIITGRGIHSAGGVAVLKKGVSQFLDRGNYIYEERIGSFEVLGKRR